MQHLILLHGAASGSKQFEKLQPQLAADFIIHTPNFPGHGSDANMNTDFSVASFADAIINYMDVHKIETTNIFGYSLGGYTGMYIAKKFPARISRLITLATKFYWDENIAVREAAMLHPEKIEQKVPQFATLLQTHHGEHWKNVLYKTQELLTGIGSNPAVQQDDYTNITTPCCIMLGDRDKMVTIEETLAVYKQLTNAQMCMLPGTPHPFEQVDTALLSVIIRRFLL